MYNPNGFLDFSFIQKINLLFGCFLKYKNIGININEKINKYGRNHK